MAEKGKNQKQTFLQGAAVLAVATVIVKIIGAIYKIPLKHIIGDEGFGYFDNAYLIYNVLLMVSTTGLPVAMSRMIAEAQTLENHDQVRKIFRTALSVFLVLGAVGCAGMLLFSRQLSVMITTFDTSWAAIMALAPSVLFISLIAAFRGFFQGQSNMTPTSVSQVFESVCKLVVGLGAAFLIVRATDNVTLGAGGAILGVTVGCAVSALYLWKKYRSAVREMPTGGQTLSTGTTMKQLLSIAVPITLGAAGLQIINLADTMVFMRRLVYAMGMDQDTAERLKGIYNFSQTIFNLPCAFITPITVAVIPAITGHLTMKNRRGAQMVEGSALRITGLIAAPCVFGLISMAAPIMRLLGGYEGESLHLAAVMTATLGAAVIFNAMVLVTNAVMQAHGDVTSPVIHMIIGGIVKIVLNYYLVAVPSLHIMGVPIGTVIAYVLMMTLNIIQMIRKQIIDPAAFLGIGKPMLAAVLMGACAYMANGFLSTRLGTTLGCLLAIAAGGVIYLVLVMAFKVITHDDCMLLPGGEKIAKILRVRP